MDPSPPPPDPNVRCPASGLIAALIASAGGLATLGVVLRAAAPWEAPAGSWFGLLVLAASAVSPYPFLAWAASRLSRTQLQGAAALAGVTVITAFGLAVLLDVLVLNPALLHALALLAVPPIQWVGALLLMAILLILRRLQRAADQV